MRTCLLIIFLCVAAAAQQSSPRPAWSVKGPWAGVAVDDESGIIYVMGPGRCAAITAAGVVQRTINLSAQDNFFKVRLARQTGGSGKMLLGFGTWSREMRAFDLNGKLLWSYPAPAGINDVWAADLKGDRADEIILAHNGSSEAHVLSAAGKLLWKLTAVGSAWHVAAGDVSGEGTPDVITAATDGKVHLCAADGTHHRSFEARGYALMVRTGKVSLSDKAATILTLGNPPYDASPEGVSLTALSGAGVVEWSLELPASSPPSISSALAAPNKPWLAVGLAGGRVYVVDIEKHTIVSKLEGQGDGPEVGWAAADGVPLLLVAAGNRLNAYRVQ